MVPRGRRPAGHSVALEGDERVRGIGMTASESAQGLASRPAAP